MKDPTVTEVVVNGPDDLAMSLVKGTMSLISAAACAPAISAYAGRCTWSFIGES